MYEEPLKRKNNTLVCHSRESGNPLLQTLTSFWIPALARITIIFYTNPETEFGATNFVGAR